MSSAMTHDNLGWMLRAVLRLEDAVGVDGYVSAIAITVLSPPPSTEIVTYTLDRGRGIDDIIRRVVVDQDRISDAVDAGTVDVTPPGQVPDER